MGTINDVLAAATECIGDSCCARGKTGFGVSIRAADAQGHAGSMLDLARMPLTPTDTIMFDRLQTWLAA